MGTAYGVPLKRLSKKINWKLLLFLLLFLNVKLVVKIAAILLIYILQPDRHTGIHFKQPKLPLFYVMMIGIAVIDFLLFRGYAATNYAIVFLLGIFLWVICILAAHQLKFFVEHTDSATIYHTLACFFIINAGVSAFQFLRIIIETGAINPFLYQGQFQKYFINTGDYIKGVSFDTSTVNAAISSFGVIFFLSRKKTVMLLVCMFSLLLTASNLVNLILVSAFAFLFLFKSDREQKSMITVCIMLMVIFITKVSPQNYSYAGTVTRNFIGRKVSHYPAVSHPYSLTEMPDSALNAEQRKEKKAMLYLDSIGTIRLKQRRELYASDSYFHFASNIVSKPSVPEPNIHTPPFQRRDDTNAIRQRLLDFVACCHPLSGSTEKESSNHIPGKLVAMDQTIHYLKDHPARLITGAGIANYSSKLAFKATSLQIAGNYPKRYAYINPAFSSDHLNLYLGYFTGPAKLHSVVNSPNSVYDQLAGEYGLAGVLAFLVGYLGFFLKNTRKSSYTIPLLIMLLGLFCMDYWFEQLSIVIIFELMAFLDQKETRQAEI